MALKDFFNFAPKNFARTQNMQVGSSTTEDTPFRSAAQEWDNRVGNATVQAKNWRIMAFSCLGLAAIFAGGFVAEALTSHWHVFVVPVDTYGKPGKIQLAGDAYNPTAAQQSAFLATWVHDMFSHPTDPVVMTADLQKAYAALDGSARNTVTQWVQKNDPTKERAGFARTVEIKTVLQKAPNSFQVEWIERQYDNGTQTGQQQFTGLFTVKTVPPKTEEQILANPLGIRINSISWTRT